jgi:lipopolysaccharide export LptBFGC system permease protein LptF
MILQRYVFRELVLHFLFTLVVVTGIFVVALGVQTLLHYSELPLLVVVRSFPYFIPYSFTYTMPMALLVAVVLTYARLSADGEILAVRTAGMHLYPIISPSIALAMVLSLASFWVNDRLIPYANVKKRAIEQFAMEQIVSDLQTGKSSALAIPSVNLTWEKALPDGTLRNPVLVLASSEGGQPKKLLADTARVWLVHSADGTALHVEFGGLRTLARVGDEESTYHLPGQIGHMAYEFALDEIFESRKKPDDRPIAELIHLSRLRGFKNSAKSSYCEIHRRLAFSGAFLAFVLVGAPLGILFRRAGKMAALLVSFLVVMVGYYPLFMLGQALAESDRLPSSIPYWIGYWIADVAVSLLGVGLLVRVFRQ